LPTACRISLLIVFDLSTYGIVTPILFNLNPQSTPSHKAAHGKREKLSWQQTDDKNSNASTRGLAFGIPIKRTKYVQGHVRTMGCYPTN
jgi:hypothetical protein